MPYQAGEIAEAQVITELPDLFALNTCCSGVDGHAMPGFRS